MCPNKNKVFQTLIRYVRKIIYYGNMLRKHQI